MYDIAELKNRKSKSAADEDHSFPQVSDITELKNRKSKSTADEDHDEADDSFEMMKVSIPAATLRGEEEVAIKTHLLFKVLADLSLEHNTEQQKEVLAAVAQIDPEDTG